METHRTYSKTILCDSSLYDSTYTPIYEENTTILHDVFEDEEDSFDESTEEEEDLLPEIIFPGLDDIAEA